MPPTAGTRTSARQGRATVRPTNYYARGFAGRLAGHGLDNNPEASATPGFLPALTHFTSAVDAFPKEMIKHFSMFKEVEAKLHDPQQMLEELLREIAELPVVNKAQKRAAKQASVPTENGANSPPSVGGLSIDERNNITRRQLFYRLRILIASMIPTLDEKLVVLQGAKATKDKGLVRMTHSYSQLDGEISDEARYGSLTHWAYADREEKKKGGPSHERQRRDVASANNLAAAAQHVHDVDTIAAKSEARREAMMANKRNRQQQIDSDFDDRPARKPQKRKPLPADVSAEGRNIGLGISSNGLGQPNKRKKTEKALAAAAAAAAAAPMERSLSSALKAAGSGGRSGSSPRLTPGPENGAMVYKRKPRAAPIPAPRKAQLPPHSPPVASSPLAANFVIGKANTSITERPLSARARKNSMNSVVSAVPQDGSVSGRPQSAHSIAPVANSSVVVELEQAAGSNRDNASSKGAPTPRDIVEVAQSFEPTSLKREEEMELAEAEIPDVDGPAIGSLAARTGRSSKTATPVAGSFPEIPMSRGRSTRNGNNGNSTSNASSENNSTVTGTVSKRGHKKSAHSVTNVTLESPALKPTRVELPSSTASSVVAENEDVDAKSDDDSDEPRYCYCNQVSYGNMIACDYEECPKEWFHLPCVNLNRVPASRTKWFCSDECQENHAKSKTKKGRPGSSRQ